MPEAGDGIRLQLLRNWNKVDFSHLEKSVARQASGIYAHLLPGTSPVLGSQLNLALLNRHYTTVHY
jgi:hypothetical protein